MKTTGKVLKEFTLTLTAEEGLWLMEHLRNPPAAGEDEWNAKMRCNLFLALPPIEELTGN